jgi:predicted flap endonuclease-1-like 5' DNA nuclease
MRYGSLFAKAGAVTDAKTGATTATGVGRVNRPGDTGRWARFARLGVFVATCTATLGLLAGTARASHYAVGDIPTLISADDAAKLTKAGVATTEDLLTKGGKAKDRKALAKASGLKANVVMDLVRRADLLRIKGIGPEMVLLLEAADVKTVADLAKKEAPALTTTADAANKAKKITEKPPTEPQFQDWIDQAKKLPAVVEGK